MSDAHEQSVSTQHITQHIAHADTADTAGTAGTADTAERSPLGTSSGLRACSRRIGAGYRRRSCQHRPATRRGCPPHTAAQSRSRNSLRAATPPRSVSQAVSHCQPSGRCCLEQVRKGRGQRAAARTVVGVLAHGLHMRRRVLRAKAVLAAVHHRVVPHDCTTTDALSDSSTEASCSPL